METVKVGLIGSQFVSSIHAEALKQVPNAEILAVASPTRKHVNAFARTHGIPHVFTDYKKMLEMDELDLVVLGLPNFLHAEACVACAKAGKHVICEKPLCMNLGEADAMIDTCKRHGVKLMYAEELCFTPKYVRLKQLIDEGALGRVYMIKQSEKHDGPHSPWFWDVKRSGGGVALDMGCHALEFFRWLLGKPKATSVYADMGTYVHKDKTKGDDNTIIIVKFEGDVTCIAEESWAKKGGMDDCAEVYGSEGVAYANLLRGSSILTFSDRGYGYAVEKSGTTKGWSFTMFEEIWNYGFPQEMQHFVDCVQRDEPPRETGEDGRAVLEIIFGAYESARTGRRIGLPFPTTAKSPHEQWMKTRK